MKSILKTLPDTLNLDYEETFMSPSNVNTKKKLIPELIKALKPNFQPTYEQITKWLKSIHKSRRSRNSYKNKGRLDADDRHLHTNGRMKDKKLRRIKGAKALYEKNDPKIVKYKRNELFDILQNSKVHSPERSETDEETDSSEKRKIFVYDRSWRLEELKTLLRDVLDPYSFSLQAAQLTRLRIYADEEQQLDVQPPSEMPDWACVG
ncbi:unnamed protein product [Rhizophagus irregularis]|nr:unnamed protein product [Rhizophagus irregularis]